MGHNKKKCTSVIFKENIFFITALSVNIWLHTKHTVYHLFFVLSSIHLQLVLWAGGPWLLSLLDLNSSKFAWQLQQSKWLRNSNSWVLLTLLKHAFTHSSIHPSMHVFTRQYVHSCSYFTKNDILLNLMHLISGGVRSLHPLYLWSIGLVSLTS